MGELACTGPQGQFGRPETTRNPYMLASLCALTEAEAVGRTEGYINNRCLTNMVESKIMGMYCLNKDSASIRVQESTPRLVFSPFESIAPWSCSLTRCCFCHPSPQHNCLVKNLTEKQMCSWHQEDNQGTTTNLLGAVDHNKQKC